MTTGEKVAGSILKPINPGLVIILGVYTVVWGLWLISPFWTVFTQAPLYSDMSDLAPETCWGVTAVVSGLLVIRGALKPKYDNLVLGAFVGTLYWGLIAVMYFHGDWQNTGGITATMVAAYCGIVWLNVKVNKGYFN